MKIPPYVWLIACTTFLLGAIVSRAITGWLYPLEQVLIAAAGVVWVGLLIWNLARHIDQLAHEACKDGCYDD